MVSIGELVGDIERHIRLYGIDFMVETEVLEAYQELPQFLQESCSLDRLQTLLKREG